MPDFNAKGEAMRLISSTCEARAKLAVKVLAGFSVGSLASLAYAQDSESYYKGKTIQIYVAGTSGGGIDVGARTLGRHLGKYLPGSPNVIVQNMPGAGGVRAMDFLYTQAPKDGTAIGAFATGPLLAPLIGARPSPYGIDEFTAIGALQKGDAICTTWHTSKVKTLEDARLVEVTVAGTGAGSGTDIDPLILNEVLGTKFKVITGYLGTQETALAMERGEVDGRCGFGIASIRATRPQWLTEGKLNLLVQNNIEKSQLTPNVPWSLELADTPDKKAMINLISAPLALRNPYLGPPQMPADRTADVRKAFMSALQDAEMITEFEKLNGGERPEPTDGATAQKILASIQATPKAALDRVKAILK
jgi:tripartite-type tricarboxylate transporter receptor subunit TctC